MPVDDGDLVVERRAAVRAAVEALPGSLGLRADVTDERYWRLHAQPRERWQVEVEV